MRKIPFIGLALACGLAMCFRSTAALIVHEPFEYPPGPLTNQSGGAGWPAAWTNTGNGTVVSPGLVYDDTWNRLISSGNACGMNTVANARDLPATYGAAGQTVYVSFVGRVDSAFAAGLVLSDGNAFRCRIGRVTQPTWQVADLSGVVIDSGLSSLQTSLNVVRLDFAASTVTMSLYVNPPLATEPGTPTGSITRPTFTFNRIQVLGSGANVRLIDEIRLGTTWADVTPHAPSPLQLFVGGVSLPEGNSGTTDFVFNVGLNQTHNQPVTVDFLTANGTAVSGSDFIAANGSLTFNPGETNKTVTVKVNGDASVEYDETFFLVLTNSVNAPIHAIAGTGTGRILDDDYVVPALFAAEPFEYASGTALAGLNGGTGWSNVWIGTFSGATVTSPGLTYTDGSSTLSVSSNSLSVSSSSPIAYNRVVQDLSRVKTGTVYVSFIGEVAAGNPVTINLVESGAPRLLIGRQPSSLNWSATALASGANLLSSVPAGTRSLLVVRLDYDSTSTSIRFYVNPTLASEPAVPAGQTNVALIRFDSLTLSGGSFDTMTALFDEIRVASTWAAAVPTGALPPPQIRISSGAIREGDFGTSNLIFNVVLSRAALTSVPVSFATADGTALAGSDYVATNGVLTFSPGETNKSIAVAVNGDPDPEPDERLSLLLSNAVNATIQTGTAVGIIRDDDTPPKIVVFGGRTHEGDFGDTYAVFDVVLSHAWKETVTVSYGATNGTATSGSDYEPKSGTLTFAPGETEKPVPVVVHGDLVDEPNETLFLLLTNAVNAGIVNGGGVGLIGNDDSAAPIGTVTTLVGTDNQVPDETNRVFKQFIGAPTQNDYGEVLFVAVTAEPDGANPERGLWLNDGPEFTRIAGEGRPAAGHPEGWTYSGDFANPTINDDGTVLFIAGVNTPGGFQAAGTRTSVSVARKC